MALRSRISRLPLRRPAIATDPGLSARLLTLPADPSGLAVYRMVLGLIMAWEAWRMLDYGWVQRYFSGEQSYFRFDWVRPLPRVGWTCRRS